MGGAGLELPLKGPQGDAGPDEGAMFSLLKGSENLFGGPGLVRSRLASAPTVITTIATLPIPPLITSPGPPSIQVGT